MNTSNHSMDFNPPTVCYMELFPWTNSKYVHGKKCPGKAYREEGGYKLGPGYPVLNFPVDGNLILVQRFSEQRFIFYRYKKRG